MRLACLLNNKGYIRMTVLDLKPGDIFECENRTYMKTDWRLKCVDLSTGEVRDFYGQNTIKIFKKTIDK